MGIEIPDELQWVAKYILGAGDWPEGDETAMRRVADAWTAMAQTLNTVDDNAAVALNAALTALSEGETHTTIAAFRDKLLSGDEATLTAVRKWCEKQAELLDDGANDIEHTKLVIIGTMIVTAAELLAAGLTAWTGIGAVAGVAARVAAQVAVRVAIRQLIARMLTRGAAKAAARLALRGAAFEALEEGGTDLSARLIQVYNGDRALSKFGLTDLGLATFGGAVGGAVGGVLGGGTNVLADGLSSTAGKLAGKVVGGSVTELGADLSAQVAAAGVGAAFLGQEFNLDIGVDTFTSAGAGGIQSTLESSANGGNATAPTVPELGTAAPGDTTPASTDAPSGDQPPTGTDNGTPDSPSNGEPTTPASTGDPSSPADDATSPQNTATGDPATASPNDNGANGTPSPGDSAPAGPNSDSAPDTGNTSPTPNPDTNGSPATPNTGDATPSSPNGNPDTGDSTPSSPENSGPTQTLAPADTTSAGPSTPVTPSPVDAAPTNGTPPTGDTTPTNGTPPTGDTTPTNATPSTGDTTPPSNPTNGATPDTPTPGDTTPNTPLDPPAQSPATDPDPANTPPAQQAPTSTTPNGVTQPESAPTTTPATPQTPPATPTTPATPPVTTTPDTQPATSTPAATTPGISPTTTPSNPATTQSAPADTTRPTSPDTSTTAATTATPVSQTGTPTPATTPTTPPPTTTPTSTPTPPITQSPTATSAPSSPRPTTLAPTSSTWASPQSTPPTPASQPNTPATAPNPPGTPTSTPTNQQDLGTNPTPPQSSNPTPATTPTRATTPTPVPTPTTDQNPDPGHSPNARPLRDSLRNLPSQDGRTTTVDTNRNLSHTRPPAYRIRRFHIGGQWVSVATIRAYIPNAHLMTPAELHQEIEYAQAAIDATFNHNQELPGGDRLLVDIEFSTNPNAADLRLNTQQHRFDLANDLREHMGLPPGKPDQPLSENDLRAISNDIARANTPARFTNPSDLRAFGPHQLAPVEQARFQTDVEDHLRNGNEFTIGADPRTNSYGGSINDGGPTVRGRSNNCLDCSLSALSSFYGRPQVSAPRNDDMKPDGTPDTESGEASGLGRAAQWLGGGLLHFGGISIAEQYQALHDHIAALGPGSSALVVNSWHARDAAGNFLYNADGTPEMRGSHATVIVYPLGATGPVWWDPQSGMTSDIPPSWMVNASLTLDFTPINPNGGNPHGGTNSHGGSSQTVAGPMVRTGPGIHDDGDAARLGQPSDTDGQGTRAGVGTGSGELRSEQADRSDHRAPQPANGDDRRGVRPSDRDGAPDTGPPSVSPTTPDQPSSDLRGPEHDPVRDAGDPTRPDGQPDHHPDADNHQAPVQLSPNRQSGGLDGFVGGVTVPSDGNMADSGDLRAVTAQPDETPSTTTTPANSSTAAPQPVPTTGLPNTPGATPHSPDSSATPPPPASVAPTPQQVQNANRSRIARDNLRTRQPDGGVQPVTDPSGRRRFTWGRHTTALGAPVSVMRIGIHLTGAANLDPAAVAALLQRAQFAVDLHFNGGFQLANGDWMMVDLVPVTNPADADMRMQVDSSGLPGTTHPDVDLSALTAQLRDQLGMDPNSDHVSPADLQQLSAAVDRATFTPPPPPWLSNPAPGTTEPGPSRPTGPASLSTTRHDTGHAAPDNGRRLPPPPRPDFRAPESNPPPRHTPPTSAPMSQAPGPATDSAPHSTPRTPHNPRSWDTQNPNHPPMSPAGFGSPDPRPDGHRPFDPRDFRAPESLPPPAPPHALPHDSSASTAPRTPQRSGSTLRRIVRRLFGVQPRNAAPTQPTVLPDQQPRPVPPRAADADGGQQPQPTQDFSDLPYRDGPPYATQEMSPTYRGEHEERNSVWEYPLRVEYLNEIARQRLRLYVIDGRLCTADGVPLDTRSGTTARGAGRAVFVMDEHGNLYASTYHERGLFHHSSFLSGGNVAAAGELVVIDGILQTLTDSSGHYRPARGHTMQAVNQLRRLGIPITPGQVRFEAPPE
ncbi:toxin glutamine deamidase domain-containing protein [Nocardia rhizosphaerihabitans]|uniref:toxin glutamine deamidase domain-containing protein n=1 Tax=Nocardia rhizosphaerihabitans TaxID=1691570 RepID=UPI00366BB0BC